MKILGNYWLKFATVLCICSLLEAVQQTWLDQTLTIGQRWI